MQYTNDCLWNHPEMLKLQERAIASELRARRAYERLSVEAYRLAGLNSNVTDRYCMLFGRWWAVFRRSQRLQSEIGVLAYNLRVMQQ
jgi:hypothetical protein